MNLRTNRFVMPTRVRPSKPFAAGAFFLALSTCLACQGAQEGRTAPAQELPRAARSVALTRVVRTPLAEAVEVSGTLSAEESVLVATKVAGRVVALVVDLGSGVKQGEVIARIDPTDYALRVKQADALLLSAKAALGLPPESRTDSIDPERTPEVLSARATVEETTRQLARVKQLVDKKLVGAADLDTAQAAAARAQAALGVAQQGVWTRLATLKQRRSELSIAEQALTDTAIHAPISGRVRERSTSLGALLSVGAPIVSLVQVDPMRLKVAVPELSARHVAAGQTILVRDDRGTAIAEGRISRVAPILSADTRTLPVEADIPLSQGLVPGAFVRASIITDAARQVLTLPTEAVVIFAGLHKVLIVDGGKVREIPVDVGQRRDGRVEITGGLVEGAAVIASPAGLAQGDSVSVLAEAERAEAR
jgi:RND family efflux transporter MFP subunit